MKPWSHARGSAKRWGGTPEAYLAIHDFIDQTKIAMPDLRHRAVLHNAFGCFLVERVFGHVRDVDGKQVSTRDIAEQHIIEDLGVALRAAPGDSGRWSLATRCSPPCHVACGRSSSR